MNWRAFILIFAGLLVGETGAVRAQDSRDIPTSIVLSYPTGVRAIGMGTTGVADNTDPSNIYFNPANVVSAPRVYLRWAHWDWASDDIENAVEAGGCWSSTISGRAFDFGADVTVGILDYSQAVRTIYLPEGNGEQIPGENFVALTTGAGTVFAKRWDARLGVGVKRFWQGGSFDRDGYGFDAGLTVAYPATASGWHVTPAAALAFVNLGEPIGETGMFRERLSARFHYGFSVHIESPRVEINKTDVPLVSITCNLDGTDPFYLERSSWAFGSEFALAQILFLRAGTVFEEGNQYFDSEVSGNSALGVGIGYPVYSALLRFDYAKLPGYVVAQDRYQLYLEF